MYHKIRIGADYYYDVVTGKIKNLSKKLVAVETIFGWCHQFRNSENQSSLALIVQENLISDQLKKFWDLEVSSLIDSKNESDVAENQIMKNFESNIKYDEKAKRYKVGLPWKLEARELKDNREIVRRRDLRGSHRKRFQKNPHLFLEYREVLQNYLKQVIIEEVIRKDRPSSQLGIVYDASSHDANSPSLNSCLHIGPNLYPEIFDILLRFRLNAVAFTADMKQAFLQIILNEEDRDVTKFLFSNDPFDESQFPSVYWFTRVFFDDIIGSQPFVNQALTITLEATKIFEDANISLNKWQTNSKSFHKAWQDKGVISYENPHFETFEKDNLPYIGYSLE
ncbi:integrase catalytic domain-containing protein [Trichonephila inaurata madagascariensis]|uniref:Integrase catalytic domain-containing protein n=1 Tax=Trichonephila inaurata madagascariensis TaxID=2747483 RepID=A0A8X6MJZ7_9ARAC|nr:integrase catalytic domain-containing protein [Trichonephila inaurata madagascariensis]